MMTEAVHAYLRAHLDEAFAKNRESIAAVADLIVERHLGGRRVYAFGSGHSHLLVEEMYYRAGGLDLVTPIWDTALMLHEDARRSSELECTPGYFRNVLRDVGWQSGDVLWLISNSGRNFLAIELAQAARSAGVTVVAMLSVAHSRAVRSASPEAPKLFEMADYILDNGGVVGDAGLAVPGIELPMVPTSTVAGAALVHAVWAEAAARLARRGQAPRVYVSFNVDDQSGDERGDAPARDSQ